MPSLVALFRKALHALGLGRDPFEAAVRKATTILSQLAAEGSLPPDEIGQPILRAGAALRSASVTPAIEQEFYRAYSQLAKLAPAEGVDDDGRLQSPFQDALADSELLLKFAAETGVEVQKEIAQPILVAHTAYRTDAVTDAIKADFYGAYSRLAKLFGEVTADSIRNCSAPGTRRTLANNRIAAVTITFLIAACSVFTFVADSMSNGIKQDIALANDAAAKLRAGLTPNGEAGLIDAKYATDDPCKYLATVPEGGSARRTVQNQSDVTQLQEFAVIIRDLRGKAIKLNLLVWRLECDPFGPCGDPKHDTALPTTEESMAQLQLNPAILNYTAEVLCKIKTYQSIRTFASNVQADYAAIFGAFASYALPIVYALLGAYAYRLRLFGETIRRRTYHPSFSDSARMITAVIAGAIAGLFNPAQGLALSPLATAFLVGYGVELFFKFLDTLINAFGSAPVGGRRSTS